MGTVTGGPGSPTLAHADRDLALAAVKAQLRVETASDDALILTVAESALGIAEQFVGQALIARTMVARLPAIATWQALPAVPVRAITGVSVNGSALPTGDYAVDIDPGAVGWVRVTGAPGPDTAAIVVTFDAGLASGWAGLPTALRQGVAVLAAHLFGDRDGTTAVPAAVTALWRPFRAMRLAGEARR